MKESSGTRRERKSCAVNSRRGENGFPASPVPPSDATKWRGEKSSRLLLGLSKREREVLRLIAEGQSIRKSARVLQLSPKTVETYRDRIKRKLAVQTGEELRWLAVLALASEPTSRSEEPAKGPVRSASK